MKTIKSLSFMFSVITLMLCGCSTTYRMNRVNTSGEDTLVFVRPDHYSILGTRSIRDHLEITYEKLTLLDNGFATLEIGVRNRGGQHWWDTKAQRTQLTATAFFYANPIAGSSGENANGFSSDLKTGNSGGTGPNQPPLYKSARTPVSVGIGETAHLRFAAPVNGVKGYQVVFSEN